MCSYCGGDATHRLPFYRVVDAISKEIQDHKTEHWKAFDKRATKFESDITKELNKYFEKQKKYFVDKIEKSLTAKAVSDVQQAQWDAWDEELQELMELFYKEIISSTGAIVAADIGASFSVMNERVLEFTENKLDKIVECNVTTQNAIKDVLVTGLEHGDDIPTMAAGIEAVFEDAIGYRSTVIARTETIGTSNWATFEAYTQSGVVTGKEWVSTRDARTRVEHEDADGQIVALDEPFIVGGEELMYPGDPKGSPENIIQCRCTIISILQE